MEDYPFNCLSLLFWERNYIWEHDSSAAANMFWRKHNMSSIAFLLYLCNEEMLINKSDECQDAGAEYGSNVFSDNAFNLFSPPY